MLSKDLTFRLRRIYRVNLLSNYGVELVEFMRFAEACNYMPWKELSRIDESKGYTLDNLTFSFVSTPTKKQMGLTDDDRAVMVDKVSERVYRLRALGKLMINYADICDKLEDLLSKCQEDFDLETLQTFMSYSGATRRGLENCLAYMDDLDISGKLITDSKKTTRHSNVKHSIVPATLIAEQKKVGTDSLVEERHVVEEEKALYEGDFNDLVTNTSLWNTSEEQDEQEGKHG